MGRIDDSLLNRFKKKLINLTLGASDYSASTAYAVGAFCLYGNNLYECNTAITTGEAWNSAKWTKTTVFGAITKNRNAINELNSKLDMQIQIGTESTNAPSTNEFDSNGMMVLEITFPKPFKEVPSVVCNVQTSRLFVGKQVEASNITTTCFTAYCYAKDMGHFGWNWIAIGK